MEMASQSSNPSNALLPSVWMTSTELADFKNKLVWAVDFGYLHHLHYCHRHYHDI